MRPAKRARLAGRRKPEPVQLLELPDDVLEHILGFCGASTLGALECTCKYFKNVLSSERFWEPLVPFPWRNAGFVPGHRAEMRGSGTAECPATWRAAAIMSSVFCRRWPLASIRSPLVHERDSILLQLHPRTENLPDHTIAICDLDVDLAFALCDQGHVFQADLLMSLVCLAFVREAHLAAPYISSAHHIQESLAAPVLLPQTAYARVLLFSCGHVHRAAVLINEALHQLRYRGIPSPAVDGILESLGGPHLPKVDTRLPPFLGAVAHPALLHKRCPTSVYDRTVHTVLEDGYLRLPRCSGEPPQKAGPQTHQQARAMQHQQRVAEESPQHLVIPLISKGTQFLTRVVPQQSLVVLLEGEDGTWSEATRIGHPCQCFARPMTTEGKVIYPDSMLRIAPVLEGFFSDDPIADGFKADPVTGAPLHTRPWWRAQVLLSHDIPSTLGWPPPPPPPDVPASLGEAAEDPPEAGQRRYRMALGSSSLAVDVVSLQPPRVHQVSLYTLAVRAALYVRMAHDSVICTHNQGGGDEEQRGHRDGRAHEGMPGYLSCATCNAAAVRDMSPIMAIVGEEAEAPTLGDDVAVLLGFMQDVVEKTLPTQYMGCESTAYAELAIGFALVLRQCGRSPRLVASRLCDGALALRHAGLVSGAVRILKAAAMARLTPVAAAWAWAPPRPGAPSRAAVGVRGEPSRVLLDPAACAHLGPEGDIEALVRGVGSVADEVDPDSPVGELLIDLARICRELGTTYDRLVGGASQLAVALPLRHLMADVRRLALPSLCRKYTLDEVLLPPEQRLVDRSSGILAAPGHFGRPLAWHPRLQAVAWFAAAATCARAAGQARVLFDAVSCLMSCLSGAMSDTGHPWFAPERRAEAMTTADDVLALLRWTMPWVNPGLRLPLAEVPPAPALCFTSPVPFQLPQADDYLCALAAQKPLLAVPQELPNAFLLETEQPMLDSFLCLGPDDLTFGGLECPETLCRRMVLPWEVEEGALVLRLATGEAEPLPPDLVVSQALRYLPPPRDAAREAGAWGALGRGAPDDGAAAAGASGQSAAAGSEGKGTKKRRVQGAPGLPSAGIPRVRHYVDVTDALIDEWDANEHDVSDVGFLAEVAHMLNGAGCVHFQMRRFHKAAACFGRTYELFARRFHRDSDGGPRDAINLLQAVEGVAECLMVWRESERACEALSRGLAICDMMDSNAALIKGGDGAQFLEPLNDNSVPRFVSSLAIQLGHCLTQLVRRRGPQTVVEHRFAERQRPRLSTNFRSEHNITRARVTASLERAEAACDRGRVSATRCHDVRSLATLSLEQGEIWAAQGRLGEACTMLQCALRDYREVSGGGVVDVRTQEMVTLATLGATQLKAGAYLLASRCLFAAQQIPHGCISQPNSEFLYETVAQFALCVGLPGHAYALVCTLAEVQHLEWALSPHPLGEAIAACSLAVLAVQVLSHVAPPHVVGRAALALLEACQRLPDAQLQTQLCAILCRCVLDRGGAPGPVRDDAAVFLQSYGPQGEEKEGRKRRGARAAPSQRAAGEGAGGPTHAGARAGAPATAAADGAAQTDRAPDAGRRVTRLSARARGSADAEGATGGGRRRRPQVPRRPAGEGRADEAPCETPGTQERLGDNGGASAAGTGRHAGAADVKERRREWPALEGGDAGEPPAGEPRAGEDSPPRAPERHRFERVSVEEALSQMEAEFWADVGRDGPGTHRLRVAGAGWAKRGELLHMALRDERPGTAGQTGNGAPPPGDSFRKMFGMPPDFGSLARPSALEFYTCPQKRVDAARAHAPANWMDVVRDELALGPDGPAMARRSGLLRWREVDDAAEELARRVGEEAGAWPDESRRTSYVAIDRIRPVPEEALAGWQCAKRLMSLLADVPAQAASGVPLFAVEESVGGERVVLCHLCRGLWGESGLDKSRTLRRLGEGSLLHGACRDGMCGHVRDLLALVDHAVGCVEEAWGGALREPSSAASPVMPWLGALQDRGCHGPGVRGPVPPLFSSKSGGYPPSSVSPRPAPTTRSRSAMGAQPGKALIKPAAAPTQPSRRRGEKRADRAPADGEPGTPGEPSAPTAPSGRVQPRPEMARLQRWPLKELRKDELQFVPNELPALCVPGTGARWTRAVSPRGLAVGSLLSEALRGACTTKGCVLEGALLRMADRWGLAVNHRDFPMSGQAGDSLIQGRLRAVEADLRGAMDHWENLNCPHPSNVFRHARGRAGFVFTDVTSAMRGLVKGEPQNEQMEAIVSYAVTEMLHSRTEARQRGLAEELRLPELRWLKQDNDTVALDLLISAQLLGFGVLGDLKGAEERWVAVHPDLSSAP